MWEDPIVAEVREIREKLAAKFGFDVKAIFADLRKRQGSLGGRLIPQKKLAEPAAEADRGRHSGSAGSTSSEAAPVEKDRVEKGDAFIFTGSQPDTAPA